MQDVSDIELNGDLARQALAAIRAAAGVCQAVQQDLVTAQTLENRDRSPVTIADFASQAVVCALLADAGIPVVGEEDAAAPRDPANRAQIEAVTGRASMAVGRT